MNPERLETGWGPGAAPRDHLLQAVLENVARAVEHWPEASGGRVVRLLHLSLADHSCASEYFNAATLLRPVIQPDDPVLDEISPFYGGNRNTPVTVWSGYGAALTWAAATSWPGKPAYLLASDEGRRVYERIGFLALFRFTLWRIPPSSRSAATDT